MPKAYKKKIHELAEVLGLKEDIYKPVKSFSGGMKRKLEIIRSLTHSPQILFLDEPTTGLHFADVQKLMNSLSKLIELGNTVVVIEHNLDVIRHCQYVVDMGPEGGDGGGQILYQGPLEGLKKVKGSHTARYV
jgi:excinuclease UvrABC ATPase subunit